MARCCSSCILPQPCSDFLFSLSFFLFLAQNLTTCEVCGACFETRKGLSSHARSHLRQLGVAESESSGAPIDLLYELMKQKGKPDGSPMSPTLGKKSGSPKDATTGSPRPTLLALGKAGDRPPDGPVNKAIKSPPGFSKNLSQPGSPILKKVPPALSGSPSPKNPEEKSSKLSLSPLQSSPKAQWPQADEEGPLNLSECLLVFLFSMFPIQLRAGEIPGFSHPVSAKLGIPQQLGGRRAWWRSWCLVMAVLRRYGPPGCNRWRGRSFLSGQTGIPVGISGKLLAFRPLSSSHLPPLLLSPLSVLPGCGLAGVEHPPVLRLDLAQPAPSSQRSVVGLASVSSFPTAISSIRCARRGTAAALGTAALVLPCPSLSPSSIGDLF